MLDQDTKIQKDTQMVAQLDNLSKSGDLQDYDLLVCSTKNSKDIDKYNNNEYNSEHKDFTQVMNLHKVFSTSAEVEEPSGRYDDGSDGKACKVSAYRIEGCRIRLLDLIKQETKRNENTMLKMDSISLCESLFNKKIDYLSVLPAPFIFGSQDELGTNIHYNNSIFNSNVENFEI